MTEREPVAIWMTSERSSLTGRYQICFRFGNPEGPAKGPPVGFGAQAAVQHAAAVTYVAGVACYEAAMARQIAGRSGNDPVLMRELIGEFRERRGLLPKSILDALLPLELRVGVNTKLQPFLTVILDGTPIGQWDINDAHHHARTVLETIPAVDGDNIYHAMIAARSDDKAAERVVSDLEPFRTSGEYDH